MSLGTAHRGQGASRGDTQAEPKGQVTGGRGPRECWGQQRDPGGPCRDRTKVGGSSTPGTGTAALQRAPKSDRGERDNQGCSGGSRGVATLSKW